MNDRDCVASTITDLEPDTFNDTLGAKKSPAHDSRFSIYVRSYRRLNHDPDGISAKAAIDGIVARGILPDDSAKEVKEVRFESFIDDEEQTIIEINGGPQ